MDSKVRSFDFPERSYLLHSVQMAGTGDFLKKLSEISPVGVSFVSVFLSFFFVFFAMSPPAIRLFPEMEYDIVYVVSERPAVDRSGPMVDLGG